ncbi:hypothetical protein [Parasedimentitalea huanghaiensis]|uniref:Uncharacterized protein n=1 Tax=Parasedimentitalea huanghaiensis TaxID=2682100 RepID=A0A6L6WAT9_9RHOB|nr:hypothetical protein [Zongyanglinia huanghaiensis]MVO14794.1 hypothetical protein [Zongyanglinia huanghaiensis]
MKIVLFLGVAVIAAGASAYLLPYPDTWVDTDFVKFAGYMSSLVTAIAIPISAYAISQEIRHRSEEIKRQNDREKRADLESTVREIHLHITESMRRPISISSINGEGRETTLEIELSLNARAGGESLIKSKDELMEAAQAGGASRQLVELHVSAVDLAINFHDLIIASVAHSRVSNFQALEGMFRSRYITHIEFLRNKGLFEGHMDEISRWPKPSDRADDWGTT